jgi:NSS family neurotransmitter:Na+ symporter
MIELASRILQDMGLTRGRAIAVVGIAGLLCGVPSALNMAVFQNQDWVWGVGLMLSGFFFAVAVLKYGVTEWREKYINTGHSDIRIGAWWDWAVRLVVVEAVVLIGWMLIQARGDGWAAALTPFSSYNIGSVLVQWAIVLVVLMSLNRFLVSRTLASGEGDALARGGPAP